MRSSLPSTTDIPGRLFISCRPLVLIIGGVACNKLIIIQPLCKISISTRGKGSGEGEEEPAGEIGSSSSLKVPSLLRVFLPFSSNIALASGYSSSTCNRSLYGRIINEKHLITSAINNVISANGIDVQ